MNKGLLSQDIGSRDKFNSATSGLISIDENDDMDVDSLAIGRIWKYVNTSRDVET